MEPGPEHFGTMERLVLDTMSTEMSVSALVCFKPWSISCFLSLRLRHKRTGAVVMSRLLYIVSCIALEIGCVTLGTDVL